MNKKDGVILTLNDLSFANSQRYSEETRRIEGQGCKLNEEEEAVVVEGAPSTYPISIGIASKGKYKTYSLLDG